MRSGWVIFNWDGLIGPHSVVHIQACECRFLDNKWAGDEDLPRHRDDADMWGMNVRPHGVHPGGQITGGVNFHLQFEWDRLLVGATDIIFMGEPALNHVVYRQHSIASSRVFTRDLVNSLVSSRSDQLWPEHENGQ